MATYVMGDIHGEYDLFMELIDKIKLKHEDTLYIMGDVIDRGPHPIKTMFKLMEMPNVICIVGNHELMALECLEFLMKEITEESIEELDDRLINNLVNWQYNGSKTTIDEFRRLKPDEQCEVIEFIKDFSLYEELTVNDKDYLLVHAGLGNFSPDKDIEDYSLSEIVWDRADYDKKYFDDIYLVTGHTPTQLIESNPKKGYIYKKNNHIAVDCGACFYKGRLAAVCLDTGKEFYSSTNKRR
ncbi:MAG: fructose-bisphosphatase class III [Lachnospiraceae bacterium]|nr:fructose-bisphosphatase class III [Lachnospiraceae bacterium]